MLMGLFNFFFMGFCKNYVVNGVSDFGFLINNVNKDLGYFLKMIDDMGIQVKIVEGIFIYFQVVVDVGMGDGNVFEIFDYFMMLEC